MDDEPIITMASPPLAKVAVLLITLVASLGVYIWQHEVNAREKLDGRVDDIVARVATLETKAAVSESHTTGMREDIKAIRDIVEKLRRR